MPGKCYKIKVDANDTLTINETYDKSASAFLSEKLISGHFVPVFEGNGVDHMNFNFTDLSSELLQPGDEIAVFDGGICVGTAIISKENLQKKTVSVAASAFVNPDFNGFTEGNNFTLKLWKSNYGKEYTIQAELVKGPVNFRRHETAFLNLEKYLITSAGDIVIHEKPSLKCYPNPFMEEISIEVFLPESSVLSVEIIAQDGRLVRQLTGYKQTPQGVHLYKWDGTNGQNATVAAGLYYLKISTDNHELRHKIIFNK